MLNLLRRVLIKKAKYNYILVWTDGYSFKRWFFRTLTEADEEMHRQYHNAIPRIFLDECKELSKIENGNRSILYDNTENVYVWEIFEIPS